MGERAVASLATQLIRFRGCVHIYRRGAAPKMRLRKRAKRERRRLASAVIALTPSFRTSPHRKPRRWKALMGFAFAQPILRPFHCEVIPAAAWRSHDQQRQRQPQAPQLPPKDQTRAHTERYGP